MFITHVAHELSIKANVIMLYTWGEYSAFDSVENSTKPYSYTDMLGTQVNRNVVKVEMKLSLTVF